MLKLFQSIFGGGELKGQYPEPLIEMAIERTVDGTDPRLRALPGYRKRLRAPVIHAIDHVIALIGILPAPLPADSSVYGSDPRLMAMFASADHMRETYAKSKALRDYREQHSDTGERVMALLLAERAEKNILGVELAGDMVRREVAQVVVNFHNHRLLDPAASEEEARKLLRRRAFDHLLSLALARIAEAKGERADLTRQRDLLRRKLGALKQGGWSFDDGDGERPSPAALQADLVEIEKQLAEMGADSDTLSRHLDMVADMLAHAEQHFWTDTAELYLDRMNIQRPREDATAQHLRLQELNNARGQRVVMLLVSLRYDELPRQQKLSDMAERYLR
jgi:hypothetical protein